jgi:hypothetical protein
VAYLYRFFGAENLERFATARYNAPRPVWYYLPIVAGGMLPWTPFMALWIGPMRDAWRRRAVDPTVLRLAVWAAAPDLAFYSVSTVEARLSRTLATRRFTTMLLVLFGVAALTLAGLGTAPEGETLRYAWERRRGNPAVEPANAGTATATFTAPTVSAETVFRFRLTVRDPHGARDRDSVDVTSKLTEYNYATRNSTCLHGNWHTAPFITYRNCWNIDIQHIVNVSIEDLFAGRLCKVSATCRTWLEIAGLGRLTNDLKSSIMVKAAEIKNIYECGGTLQVGSCPADKESTDRR